jgi:hypothetical protein
LSDIPAAIAQQWFGMVNGPLPAVVNRRLSGARHTGGQHERLRNSQDFSRYPTEMLQECGILATLGAELASGGVVNWHRRCDFAMETGGIEIATGLKRQGG